MPNRNLDWGGAPRRERREPTSGVEQMRPVERIVVHNNAPEFMERDKATAAKSATSSPPTWNTPHEAWTPSGPAGGTRPKLGSFGGAAHDTHARAEYKPIDVTGMSRNERYDAQRQNRSMMAQAKLHERQRLQDMGWQDDMTGHSRQARADDQGYAATMTGHKIQEDYWKGSLAQQATNEANRAEEWGLSRQDERGDIQYDRDQAQADTLLAASMNALSGGSQTAQQNIEGIMSDPARKKEMLGLLEQAMGIIDKGTSGQDAIKELAPFFAYLQGATGIGKPGPDIDPLESFKSTENLFEVMIKSGKVNENQANQVLDALQKDAMKEHQEWRKRQMTATAEASAKDVTWQSEGDRRADQVSAWASAQQRQVSPGGATFGEPSDARWADRPVPAQDPRAAYRKRQSEDRQKRVGDIVWPQPGRES